MWISEKEIYCRVLNADKCAKELATRRTNGYGVMAMSCFIHAMCIAVALELNAKSIKPKSQMRLGQGNSVSLRFCLKDMPC